MTTQSTQDFIIARTAAIKNEINELQKELAALKALKTTLSNKPGRVQESNYVTSETPPGMTFQDMIVAVLNDRPTGRGEAVQILDWIYQKFGKRILRSSISPQLSRLKALGVLDLVSGEWILTGEYFKPKTEAAPQGDGSDLV